jgi:hypothetical protein
MLACFLMPSDALLAKIVKSIDWFVAKGCLEEGPIRPLIHMPNKAVESLPWDMGGVQRVDIPAQVQALQAKVAAMLLHPRRHAWKVLMHRAFQRYVPALGPAVFVSKYAPANKAGRCSSRHVAYWRAIARLKPHRLLEPGRMSAHQHLQERLASNCRITRHGDSLVPSGTWLQELLPAVHDAGGLTVGGLRVALGSSDAAVLRAAERVRACIGQPEWVETASTQALPPADWWQSPCGGSVYWQAAPEGGKGFAVRADGRLAPLMAG